MLRRFESGDGAFEQRLDALRHRGDADLERVEPVVRQIIDEVRQRGNAALYEFTERFDKRRPEHIKLPDHWKSQARSFDPTSRRLLEHAVQRVKAYHEHQRENGFQYETDGIALGQRISPLRSVCVYAPGGQARYPSSVIMTAAVASVAGVPRIVLATPNPTAEILCAAWLSGVTEVVDLGGAQAVAAMSYGTETIEPVDKVVGPGNLYVACAKKLVFGKVDIDQIAGPSEILVVADDGASPAVVAADLLSQAEHDADAYPLLITFSASMADRVDQQLEKQLAGLPRRTIAERALRDNGWCFVVRSESEAVRVTNALAPEHLCLAVARPESMLERIDAAGAVFMGYHTPESTGDYAAGPSHVLPTGGTARFNSPLGVYDFMRRTSVIRYTRDALRDQAPTLTGLARMEGLEAHARAVERRVGTPR